jgi:predicted nucleic acid-binding protein
MNICLDASFLIGLYDKTDQYHKLSKNLFSSLFDSDNGNAGVVVWPVLYESVSTRLVKSQVRTTEMERDWRRLISAQRLIFLDDKP